MVFVAVLISGVLRVYRNLCEGQ